MTYVTYWRLRLRHPPAPADHLRAGHDRPSGRLLQRVRIRHRVQARVRSRSRPIPQSPGPTSEMTSTEVSVTLHHRLTFHGDVSQRTGMTTATRRDRPSHDRKPPRPACALTLGATNSGRSGVGPGAQRHAFPARRRRLAPRPALPRPVRGYLYLLHHDIRRPLVDAANSGFTVIVSSTTSTDTDRRRQASNLSETGWLATATQKSGGAAQVFEELSASAGFGE